MGFILKKIIYIHLLILLIRTIGHYIYKNLSNYVIFHIVFIKLRLLYITYLKMLEIIVIFIIRQIV